MSLPSQRAVPADRLAPWVGLWTLLFLIANRSPLLGRATPVWDAVDSFYPFFVLTADHARAGRLVLWDVWSNAGLPRLGDPEFGALWPLQLLVGLVSGGTTMGFIAYWLLVWWLGGVGMFLLARHLRVPPWSAFVVVVGFTWSGVYTGHAEHISWLVGFSALPWIVWRLDRALCTRTCLPAIQSGAVWGAAATAAYPGITIVTAFLVAAWTIGRVITEPAKSGGGTEGPSGRPGPTFVHGMKVLAAVGSVGVLCLLPTYVSFFYDGAGVHQRTGPLPREVAITNNALDPGALVTIVSPHFSSLKYHSTSTPLWPGTDVSSVSIYSGALVLVLAVSALVVMPRSRWRWFLAALALFWLGASLGDALPLRGWLYDWIYPTRFFRHPAMFRVYFVFSLTVLALLGAGGWATALGSPVLRRRCSAAALATAAAGVLVYWSTIPAGAASLPDSSLGRWHIIVAWGGMAAVGVLVLAARRLQFVSLSLVLLASGDALLTGALTQHTMFSTLPDQVARWRDQNRKHATELDLTGQGLTRTLQPCELDPPCAEPSTWGMIKKVPALVTYSPATNQFFDQTIRQPILAESAVGPSRTWFTPIAARTEVDSRTFGAFLDRAQALGGIPVVVHSEQSMLGASRPPRTGSGDEVDALPRAERIPATIDLYTSNELRMTVTVPSAGWLLVTERWGRGWRARVDGEPTPVLGGNFVFRVIQVPEGVHRVAFSYHPIAMPWLVALGWTTMFAVSAGSCSRRSGW